MKKILLREVNLFINLLLSIFICYLLIIGFLLLINHSFTGGPIFTSMFLGLSLSMCLKYLKGESYDFVDFFVYNIGASLLFSAIYVLFCEIGGGLL